MALATSLESAVLTITDTPAYADLHVWWQTRQADPGTAIAFTDDGPQDFAELCDRIEVGDFLFYLARDSAGEVVGAMWLHDLVRDTDDTPRAGWLGTYVLPAYRGIHTTQAMWELVQEAVAGVGVQSVYIASHHANTRAHRVAEHHLGFYRVDLFPSFALFGGKPADCLILSMRPEDTAEAWALAYTRASKQGLHSTWIENRYGYAAHA
jgi:RimJ/RimL family protein N-acetyltransferase